MSKQQVNLPGTQPLLKPQRMKFTAKVHCKIMLVLMQKLKAIWSFLQKKKIANYSLTPQRLVSKTLDTTDTGIQLKIMKCAKRILNKGLLQRQTFHN